MTSPLENLVATGDLKREAPDAKEYAGLVRAGQIRLGDAEHAALSLESRFTLAYDAAHALSLAALRRLAYRSEKRYVVFQTLPHTLGVGPGVWRVLADAHKRRNDGEYRGMLDVNERTVSDLLTACRAVATALDRLPFPG